MTLTRIEWAQKAREWETVLVEGHSVVVTAIAIGICICICFCAYSISLFSIW